MDMEILNKEKERVDSKIKEFEWNQSIKEMMGEPEDETQDLWIRDFDKLLKKYDEVYLKSLYAVKKYLITLDFEDWKKYQSVVVYYQMLEKLIDQFTEETEKTYQKKMKVMIHEDLEEELCTNTAFRLRTMY